MKKRPSEEDKKQFLAQWETVGKQIVDHPEIGSVELESIVGRDLQRLPRTLSATGVGVAVPCAPGRAVTEETLGAVSKLAFEFGLRPSTVQSFEIANNRENLTDSYINAGYRRMLFLDSDTVVDGPGYLQLMQTMDRFGAAVVGAFVPQRFTGELNGFEEDSSSPSGYSPVKKENLPQSLTPFPIPYIGLAVALLDLEQIRQHPGPRFKRVAEGHKHLGEDITFCDWVRKNDMEVIVDPRVSTIHCVQHRFMYQPPKREET